MSEAVGPSEPPAPSALSPVGPPSVDLIVRAAVDALADAGSELRVLSAAVILFGLVAVGIPLRSVVLYSAAVAMAAGPNAVPVASSFAVLVAGLVGAVALLILFVQVPLFIIATVGGRVAGQPVTLRQALRRGRQVFVQAIGAVFLITVASSVPTLITQGILVASLGPTQLADGLALLARVVWTAPWVYVLPGIVLGGVGTGEAVRRSWRVARYRGRIALTIALFAVIGQTIVVAAANAALGPIATLFGLASTGTTVPAGLAPAVALGLLIVAAIVEGSLLFGTQLVQFAPQASGFYVLTRYSAGLDAARSAAPEPLFSRPARVFYAVGSVAGLVVLAGVLPILSAN